MVLAFKQTPTAPGCGGYAVIHDSTQIATISWKGNGDYSIAPTPERPLSADEQFFIQDFMRCVKRKPVATPDSVVEWLEQLYDLADPRGD